MHARCARQWRNNKLQKWTEGPLVYLVYCNVLFNTDFSRSKLDLFINRDECQTIFTEAFVLNELIDYWSQIHVCIIIIHQSKNQKPKLWGAFHISGIGETSRNVSKPINWANRLKRYQSICPLLTCKMWKYFLVVAFVSAALLGNAPVNGKL